MLRSLVGSEMCIRDRSKISEPAAVTATVVAPPVAVMTPVCEILPPAVNDKSCPMLEVPMTNALLLTTVTLFAPLFDNDTAPVKLFACVKVIAFAPAEKLDVPGTINAPVCVIAPLDEIVKFCPTDEAANTVAILLVKETLLAPLFDNVTAPVKLFACVKVIAFAPALKLEVPGTVSAPV